VRRKHWAGVGAVLAAGLAIAAPSTLVAESPSDEPAAPVAPVTTVDASTRELLHVFDRARTAADALPQPVGADPATPDSLPGEAYDLSRRADPPGPGGPVYIWPMQEGACFSTAGISSCASAAALEQREVVFAIYRGAAIADDATRVAGIAKDGIELLTVALDDGTAIEAPVSDNAFRVDVYGNATELRWTNANGERGAESLPRMSAPPPENVQTEG